MNDEVLKIIFSLIERYDKTKSLTLKITQYFEGYEAGITQTTPPCVETDECFQWGLIAGERDRELLINDSSDR